MIPFIVLFTADVVAGIKKIDQIRNRLWGRGKIVIKIDRSFVYLGPFHAVERFQ